MAKRKKPLKNLVQLPSGSWRIRYTDEQGRRKTETHKKKDDAELALARAKVEVEERRRGLRQMRPVDVRLRDVWTVWRREVGARKRSAGTDESFWRHHLEPVFGDLGVREIDSQRLAKFRARQEALGLTATTLHHHLTLLTTLLRFAHAKGWLQTAPRIAKPRMTLDEADFRYLKSSDELRRVLYAAAVESPMLFTMYAVSGLAGLRLGEVCGLRRADVELPPPPGFLRRIIGARCLGRERVGEGRKEELEERIGIRRTGSLVFEAPRKVMS